MKKYIKIISVVLLLSSLLVGCSKDVERVKVSTAEEAINLFNKYNVENNVEEMVKLYSDAYIDSMGYNTSQIISAMKKNRKDAEIKSCTVNSIEDIDENTKKAIVSIESISGNKEVKKEYTYAILKEGNGWAVSPEGVIKCVKFDVPMDKKGELNLNLVKEIVEFNSGIIKINVYNDSNSSLFFGIENNKSKVIVETTKGTYSKELEESIKIDKKVRSYFMVKMDDIQGEITKVTVTSVYDVDKEGKATLDSKRDIIIYSK